MVLELLTGISAFLYSEGGLASVLANASLEGVVIYPKIRTYPSKNLYRSSIKSLDKILYRGNGPHIISGFFSIKDYI